MQGSGGLKLPNLEEILEGVSQNLNGSNPRLDARHCLVLAPNESPHFIIHRGSFNRH